jgi:hypothetical protein
VEGDVLRLVAICDKSGSNLAFTTVKIFKGNKCIASGSQSKFVSATGRSKL